MKYTSFVFGLVITLVAFSSSAALQARAAGLSGAQISAIIQLLQSFGADQSVINNVQATLSGGSSTNIYWSGGTGNVQIGLVDNRFESQGVVLGWISLYNNTTGSVVWDGKNVRDLANSVVWNVSNLSQGPFRILGVTANSAGNYCMGNNYSWDKSYGCNYVLSGGYITPTNLPISITLPAFYQAPASSQQTPTITSLSPSSGAVGTRVQINGSGFSTEETMCPDVYPSNCVSTGGRNTVYFNGVALSGGYTSNPSSLSFTVPSNIETCPPAMTGVMCSVKIVNANGGTSNSVWFNVVSLVVTTPPPTVLSACDLDVDGNGIKDALTDGLMIQRYILGSRGTQITTGALGTNASRTNPSTIEAFIASHNYDIDGSGTIDTNDGLMITRYLFGLSGSSITSGLVVSHPELVSGRLSACTPVTQAATPSITSVTPNSLSSSGNAVSYTISGSNLSAVNSVEFIGSSGQVLSTFGPSVSAQSVTFTASPLTAANLTTSGNNNVGSIRVSTPTGKSNALPFTMIAATAETVACSFDADGSGSRLAGVDGVLISRYLSGSRGTELTNYVPFPTSATRTSSSSIEPFISAQIAGRNYDVDGNGTQDAYDGTIIKAYLNPYILRANITASGVGAGATRTDGPTIDAWITANCTNV